MVYIYISLKKERKFRKIIYLYFILSGYMALVFGILLSFILNQKELSITNIGLTSYGGALGVFLASLIFEKIIPLDNKLIKYSILSLPLTYGIAKIGCFFAGCCYGIPYNGIFGVTYIDELNISVFPVQLLESLVFIILFIVFNKYKNKDNIIYISLIGMAIFKFLLDFFRYEHYLKGITINQILSITILIITFAHFIYKKTVS